MKGTEYHKSGRISRGLHIQKGPALYLDCDEFHLKRVSIVNKCAMDVMLLIIDKSQLESTKLFNDIDKLEKFLKTQ